MSSPLAVLRTGAAVLALSLLVVCGASAGTAQASANAQSGQSGPTTLTGAIRGAITHHDTREAIAGAKVTVEEIARDVATDAAGRYALTGVPPGAYHLRITAPGFTTTRIEVRVQAEPLAQDIILEPELHYSEVLSVSPNARDVFDSYQPTTVLAGQDLAVKLDSTLGAVLQNEPGVAQRSFGPGPSRPVIRGLDGDRVLLLENGQRSDDLSAQSGDHGVTINPAAASQIEVVRGPATLLHGANAIGGLVNVINDLIPTRRVEKTEGTALVDFGSAANDTGGAADMSVGDGRFAMHVGGNGRHAGDFSTPRGEVANTQSRSAFGQVGASAITSKGYVGGSYQYSDMKYGLPDLPFSDETGIELTPRKHTVSLRAESRGLDSFVTGVRASFGLRRYQHDELAEGQVDTHFENDTSEFELLATTRPLLRKMQGTYGVSGYARSFLSDGEEALSPPVDQRNVAAYTYQEIPWSHATLQFGGRAEHVSFAPDGGLRDRDFTNLSGSVGLLLRPTESTTIAVSLARAVRNPALEELYFNGLHAGNFAFEIGNDELEPEKALGLDVSFRWRAQRLSGEVTYFRNSIGNFIFRDPTGEEEEDFPVIRFTGADSLLQGVEAHTDVELTPSLHAEVGFDAVRGELRDTDQSLPRIPPMRLVTGLRYRRNALQLGGDLVTAAKQDRVFGVETPTDGYTTLKLFGVYSIQQGRLLHTITARLENATNETYFNHLSFIKDYFPEVGRSVKLIYGIRF
jgi:iron complex outermembrane receptor protein